MTSPAPTPRVGFLHTDQPLARATRPLRRFLHVEAAGGVLLLVTTIAALAWASSPWKGAYESLWSTDVGFHIGGLYELRFDLHHLVNDVLMALFFFVVGMEIKRELVSGQLRDRRAAALPAIAALGGMVVPAVVFALVNGGGPGARGWAVPMATDIAFAVGVVTLLGRRVPPAAKVFLLALAVVDDIGAIGVIALFYSDSVSLAWLAVATLAVGAVAMLHRVAVRYPPVLVAGGVAAWFATYESGVHATIAGVLMGLLMPARPWLTARGTDAALHATSWPRAGETPDAAEVRARASVLKASVSDCDRAIDALHPWTSYVIVPVFALANAGIELSGESFRAPSAVFTGVLGGLVLGKLVGITTFSYAAVRLGVARLPDGVGWSHITGLAAVGGIGFTVALFIAGLAFDGALLADAKLAILAASLVASVTGSLLLLRAPRIERGLPSAAPDTRGTCP